jgi:hypothetical protein
MRSGRSLVTTTPELVAKHAVLEAYDTLRVAYPHVEMTATPDGQGGLWVEFAAVPLGDVYVQNDTFLVFNLPFNLPGGDIYPMFARPDLSRADGGALGEGFARTQLLWNGAPSPQEVTQLSRRTRGNAFTAQTAAQKVAKVLHWMEAR